MESSGSGQGMLADACVHSKEPLGLINGRGIPCPTGWSSANSFISLSSGKKWHTRRHFCKFHPSVSAVQLTKNERSSHCFLIMSWRQPFHSDFLYL